jgi:membrane carboxypeptidase/penicillin-binding protein
LRTRWKIVVGGFALMLFAFALQFCIAFFRTPGIVEQVKRSAGLSLQLSDFQGQRLQWLLRVQDPDFYRHHGISLGTPGAGYTTITQALVKDLFFNYSFKPGFLRWRKLQQTTMALAFNARVPKDEQLRLFVNLAYMGTRNGHSVIGLSQAAREYFGKNFQALTDEEYLALIATIVAPEKYSPASHLAENEYRVMRIRLVLAGTCKPASQSDVEYSGCGQ